MSSVEPQSFDEAVSILDEVGWFNHLNESQKTKYLKAMRALSKENNSLKLHSIIPQAFFDCECIYEDDSHTELLNEIREHTLGLFDPQNISEQWKEGDESPIITLSFELNGNIYKKTWQYESDYIDESFFLLLIESLKNEFPELIWTGINTYDQCMSIFLSTENALLKARETALLDLWAFDENDDEDCSDGYDADVEMMMNLGLAVKDPLFEERLPRKACVISKSGDWYLGLDNGQIICFHPDNPEEAKCLFETNSRVTYLDIDQTDTKLAVLDLMGEVYLYDISKKKLNWSKKVSEDGEVGKLIDFSPDNSLVGCHLGSATDLDGRDLYFDIASGSSRQEEGDSMSDWVYSQLGYMDDENNIAHIAIALLKMGKDGAKEITRHPGFIRSLLFSPDTKKCVTGCDEGYLKIIDMAKEEILFENDEKNPIFGLGWVDSTQGELGMLFKQYRIRFRDIAKNKITSEYQWDYENLKMIKQ